MYSAVLNAKKELELQVLKSYPFEQTYTTLDSITSSSKHLFLFLEDFNFHFTFGYLPLVFKQGYKNVVYVTNF